MPVNTTLAFTDTENVQNDVWENVLFRSKVPLRRKSSLGVWLFVPPRGKFSSELSYHARIYDNQMLC